MVMADVSVKVYDTGYYHIGVRPGAEDAGWRARIQLPTCLCQTANSSAAHMQRSIAGHDDPRTARRR